MLQQAQIAELLVRGAAVGSFVLLAMGVPRGARTPARLTGPTAIVTGERNVDEFRLGVRVSLQRYVRH